MKNIEFLKKVYALAMQGVGGEQENAKMILDKLLKKYSMSIEQLQEEFDDEKIIDVDIKTPTADEAKILVQIAYKVTNSSDNCYDIYRCGKRVKKVVRVKCTPKQEIELRFLYDFYRSLWFEERKFLLRAFVQKHALFGHEMDEEGNERTDFLSAEEYNRLQSAMKAFQDKSPLLQIEE